MVTVKVSVIWLQLKGRELSFLKLNERKRNETNLFFKPQKKGLESIINYNTKTIIIKNEKLTHFRINSRIGNSVQILCTILIITTRY